MGEETYEVYRKKGIRLTAEMSPLIYQYFYAPMKGKAWKGFHMFDKAHTVMLMEEKIIPAKIGLEILKALKKMETGGAEKIRESLGGHMHCGEAYVTKEIGPEYAGWIHCGRSSGDLQAVGARIDARDAELGVMKSLVQFQKTLLQKAEEHINTLMPGYTHLQHAEPITFAFYLLSFQHQWERDFERFHAAFGHTNISPAGCAILTTTDFPINRQRTRELLGFDDLYTNAKDAVWSMDFLIECLGAMACTAGGLSRLAEDLSIWHSSEFGMVEIPDEYCGTSSIMPQKKNPYGTEAIRGLYGDVAGNLMTFLTQTNHQSDACEMLTMTPLCLYVAQEKCLAAIQIMNGIIKNLKVHSEVMKKRTFMFWAQATSLANSIVKEQRLPFRTAHQIVGILVRMAYEEGKQPEEVTTEMIDRASVEAMGKPLHLPREMLQHALDPERVVKSKKAPGGTSPERVKEDILNSHRKLGKQEEIIRGIEKRLSSAEIKLEEAIQALLRQGA